MKNVKAYAVIGAGYGDEGKGLMTDYFCGNENGKVLNIKVNGGHQAGHTVCRITSGLNYNCDVFHSIGSGTFVGADTYFGQKFLVDCVNVIGEFNKYNNMRVQPLMLYINPDCRLVLGIDKFLNQFLEQLRDSEKKEHGTCGFGIFECVNRNHHGFKLTVKDAMKYLEDDTLDKHIYELSKNYFDKRMAEFCKKEKIVYIPPIYDSAMKLIQEWAMEDAHSFSKLTKLENVSLKSLDETINCGYETLVFECSQGLELDWADKRNFPHVTGSHTGIRNVVKEINSLKENKVISLETCYVTRSYKTKHGAGTFFEQNKNEVVEETYHLYDRTNVPNKWQGILQYGRLDLIRLADIINNDFETYTKEIPEDVFLVKSLSITHLDQTRESILTTDGKEKYFKEVTAENLINGDKTYYSFGEKAIDIFCKD